MPCQEGAGTRPAPALVGYSLELVLLQLFRARDNYVLLSPYPKPAVDIRNLDFCERDAGPRGNLPGCGGETEDSASSCPLLRMACESFILPAGGANTPQEQVH
jgi:hypothetical protein